MRLIRHQDKAKLHGKVRSGEWPRVRQEYLHQHPACAVCGTERHLEVHHVEPFHLKPELELEMSNLITLCESKGNGVNCHLLFGHLGNFKSINTQVRLDVESWHHKLESRP